jgi:hypothetical protein
MSTSSPVRTRQPRRRARPPQAGGNRPSRTGAVARSILLVVAAVSVIATSNYLSYLVGRKQVTYEELRRQVDRVVELVDEKRAEEELAASALKQRQERLEQNASGLSDLTTSTINGKTIVVAPEPAPAARPAAAAPIDDTPAAPREHDVQVQPSEASPNAITKQRDRQGVVHKRSLRRKVSPPSAAPTRDPAAAAMAAEPPAQSTTAIPAPDAGAGGQ